MERISSSETPSGDDLLRHPPPARERGQKEHDGGAQPRAEVGGTGGEVAELLVEGEGNGVGNGVVQPRDALPCAREVEAVHEVLLADMVLLVHHDGDDLVRGDERRGDAAVADEVARDEVALLKERHALGGQIFELVERELIDVGERRRHEADDLHRLLLGMGVL